MNQPGSSSQIATRALKWMAVSRRPLKPDELIEAAELDPATVADSVAPEVTLDIDLLIQLCGGLLLWDKKIDVIRFSHLSVQEYLETESMNKHWDIIDAQRLVMEACLWMLQCPYPPESIPLYPYAACYWFRHCRAYQDLVVQAAASNKPSKYTLDVPSLRNFLGSFDQPTASYEKWRRLVPNHCQSRPSNNIDEHKYLRFLPVCPAFGAAIGGLGQLVSWLWLAKGVDINATDLNRAPLLQYAIASGSAELVRRMITMGADINFAPKGLSEWDSLLYDGSPRGTAIVIATTFNRPEIISLLLDQGADINAVSGQDGTALGCAAWAGNVEIVSLLLERGADINVVGGHYGAALGCAAVHGNVEIVSLLLERGADINVVSGHYGTALGCAVWRGRVEIVSLLLERGADINVVGGHYGTALGCAAWAGNVEIVSLLLERGADINVVGGHYGTALGYAAWKKNVTLVTLLLERGADINLVGGNWGTTLSCICASDFEHGRWYYPESDYEPDASKVATLLLQRGADMTIQFGGQYGTALGVSASLGCTELVRLLMEHEANPDLTNDDGINPRALAEGAGHLGIVQLLDSWNDGPESGSKVLCSSGKSLSSGQNEAVAKELEQSRTSWYTVVNFRIFVTTLLFLSLLLYCYFMHFLTL